MPVNKIRAKRIKLEKDLEKLREQCPHRKKTYKWPSKYCADCGTLLSAPETVDY